MIQIEAERLVSPRPVIDFDSADQACKIVRELRLDRARALRLALALSVYNYDVSHRPTEGDLREFAHDFTPLILKERASSSVTNPLPTIGFEVEAPRIPHPKLYNREYARFFDTIGMPRNKINKSSITNSDGAFGVWEFSPPPSYCASVQNRILCELIKGRFIPSLVSSQDPSDLRQYLDIKLVSLHINLGLPRLIESREAKGSVISEVGEEIELFGSAFALGFSSYERLLNRSQNFFVLLKNAENKTRKNGKFPRRLELKAHEVRSKNIYRLLTQTQLLGAALFSHLAGTAGRQASRNPGLAQIWQNTASELRPIYQDFDIEPDILKNKEKASNLVATTNISQRLRGVIDEATQSIRKMIGAN